MEKVKIGSIYSSGISEITFYSNELLNTSFNIREKYLVKLP
jgi:hypothetical protein